MATIYEVSKLAGVSLATVSRVMNDSGRVSDKTRAKVLAAMKELDYQPNAIAQSLASNRSNSVGVLVSEMHGPIFGVMLSAIEFELRQAGKFAIFVAGHSDAEKEKEGIRFLTSRHCDALILHVEALPSEYFLEHQDSMLPFVLINRDDEGLRDHCISLDNEQGGYEATRSLLEFGHRQIGYISGPLQWADAKARLAGHRRALNEFGVPWDEALLVEGNYLETSGGWATRQLLERGVSITALVCANDEMAAGAMDVIRKRGLAIPEDISVVGFDNVRWARYLNPKLTTVDYPVAEMSRMAAQWVLKTVYGQEVPAVRHVFQPRLVARASSGPVSDHAKRASS
jgi:LacI family transcriptional regulator